MYSGSAGQDWEIVKFSKFTANEKKPELVAKTKLNSASSSVEAYQKLSKIEKEDENLHIERISPELKQQIIRARCDKKLTQADLAKKINEPLKIVQEYENGKATPNNQILQKMSRILGVTLKKKPTSTSKNG
jgi:putative transcription factor